MTKTEFRTKAEAAFLRANPSAKIDRWISIKLVTYPTGVKEFAGKFYATANGYRARTMTASDADDYVMVR